jgi:RNA polymerase sigma-70 factor (ECF subfamily)
LAQETWIAVLKGSSRYEPRAAFKSYLYGIAFRLLANERRKRAAEKGAVSGNPLVCEIETPSYWIAHSLEKLEPMDREILMLREYEQLSYVEIANLLRIPVNTVRSRLFRARVALKELFEPQSEWIKTRGRS